MELGQLRLRDALMTHLQKTIEESLSSDSFDEFIITEGQKDLLMLLESAWSKESLIKY